MCNHTQSKLWVAFAALLLISACASSYHEADFIKQAPAAGWVEPSSTDSKAYKLYQGVMQY